MLMKKGFVPIKFLFLIKLLSLSPSLKRFNEAFSYRREEAGKWRGPPLILQRQQLDADIG